MPNLRSRQKRPPKTGAKVMKKVLFFALVALYLNVQADEGCMVHSRKILRSSPHVRVSTKRNRPCTCNCRKEMARFDRKQYQGRCPICKHFHVPSEIKFRKN